MGKSTDRIKMMNILLFPDPFSSLFNEGFNEHFPLYPTSLLLIKRKDSLLSGKEKRIFNEARKEKEEENSHSDMSGGNDFYQEI